MTLCQLEMTCMFVDKSPYRHDYFMILILFSHFGFIASRSMPTSAALDVVAKHLNLKFFEVFNEMNSTICIWN